MLRTRALVLVVVLALLSWNVPAVAQSVGDRVVLEERARGIPAHASPGSRPTTRRFASGATATVKAVDPTTGWLAIEDPTGAGWIIPSYVATVLTPSAVAPVGLCYEVGTWNLEHFGKNKTRGFPEYQRGGPTIKPRTAAELTALAAVIRDTIKARILVLNEINGHDGTAEDDRARSVELDDLVTRLGPSFEYVIAKSGKAQRIALLYDTRFVRLNASEELLMPNAEVQGKGLFERRPLMGHFTFIHDGRLFNDLLVVGLHLASGQQLTKNHDKAMRMVIAKLTEARAAGVVLPTREFDVMLAGDLNASWFDDKVEEFFDELHEGDWAVLAKDPYPGTRLAGHPLAPTSQIDYLIVTRKAGAASGLFGEEITQEQATVHHDVAQGNWPRFRQRYSDHFPVTACIAVVPDND